MSITKIYGASDDLIEIEGAVSDEITCYDEKTNFSASDGTKGTISYDDDGQWRIEVKEQGDKFSGLVRSVGEDNKHIFPDAVGCTSYSDVLVLKEGIEWVKIGRKTFKAE